MPVSAEKVAKGLWWEAPWGLVVGCTAVSSGCAHCWAKSQHDRFRKRLGRKAFNVVVPREDRLMLPMRRGIPTVYAVWNDLFHAHVPGNFIDRAWEIMWLAKHHRFVVLTKRAERMRELSPRSRLSNVVLGVSVEDQKTADERIPHLIKTPAACRMMSYEPVLGPVDFGGFRHERQCDGHPAHLCDERCCYTSRIDWLITGPETGAGRRPCETDWIRDAAQQVRRAGVPVFIKALPIGKRISKDPAEWPADLRLREFPEMLK